MIRLPNHIDAEADQQGHLVVGLEEDGSVCFTYEVRSKADPDSGWLDFSTDEFEVCRLNVEEARHFASFLNGLCDAGEALQHIRGSACEATNTTEEFAVSLDVPEETKP